MRSHRRPSRRTRRENGGKHDNVLRVKHKTLIFGASISQTRLGKHSARYVCTVPFRHTPDEPHDPASGMVRLRSLSNGSLPSPDVLTDIAQADIPIAYILRGSEGESSLVILGLSLTGHLLFDGLGQPRYPPSLLLSKSALRSIATISVSDMFPPHHSIIGPKPARSAPRVDFCTSQRHVYVDLPRVSPRLRACMVLLPFSRVSKIPFDQNKAHAIRCSDVVYAATSANLRSDPNNSSDRVVSSKEKRTSRCIRSATAKTKPRLSHLQLDRDVSHSISADSIDQGII